MKILATKDCWSFQWRITHKHISFWAKCSFTLEDHYHSLAESDIIHQVYLSTPWYTSLWAVQGNQIGKGKQQVSETFNLFHLQHHQLLWLQKRGKKLVWSDVSNASEKISGVWNYFRIALWKVFIDADICQRSIKPFRIIFLQSETVHAAKLLATLVGPSRGPYTAWSFRAKRSVHVWPTSGTAHSMFPRVSTEAVHSECVNFTARRALSTFGQFPLWFPRLVSPADPNHS